jgi:RecB family exonuclease
VHDLRSRAAVDDFEAPEALPPRLRVSTSELIADPQDHAVLAESDSGSRSDRLLGIVIHRMFERADAVAGAAEGSEGREAAAAWCRRLLRPDEQLLLADQEAFVRHAAAVWLRAQARADVRDALRGRARMYEVPFSFTVADRIVRGTIDCVVEKEDGGLLVVELKTGRAHAAHDRQLALYVRATARLRGEGPVSGVLLYV